MKVRFSLKASIICLGICLILIVSGHFRELILKIFGFSFFLFPFFFIIRNITIGLYGLFLALDLVFDLLLPYRFCGLFGDFCIVINRKFYYIPILVSIGLIFYLILKTYKNIDNVFEVLDTPILTEKKENKSNLLLKILQKYSIKTEIKKIEFGHFYTRYYIQIPRNVKFGRFASLSPDLTETLKLKTRTVCDLQYSYIEIENANPNRAFFKEFIHYIQPNRFLFMSCTVPFLFDVHNNMLCYVSGVVIHSLICSLLITRINFDIILVNENDVSFIMYNQLIVNNIEISIDEIIKEIERRYKVIIPVACDIYQYNEQNNTKINFLMIFIKITKSLENNTLNYILQFGKKVGVFVVLYSEDIDMINQYLNSFSIVLTSAVENKGQSSKLIGITGAEYLTGLHDCLLKYDELILRVTVPMTSIEEITKIVKYLERKNME